MSEQIISPGVYSRENDTSLVTQGPIEAGAAIIGPTVKGPIEVPTLVTSFSQFINIFGSSIQSGSNNYTFLTNLAVQNYFNQGGASMLVTRVVSGSGDSWTPASSTINASGSIASLTLETLSEGVIMNNSGSEVSGALASGSADNVRWEIVSPNSSTGTFTLLVRQGNDNNRSKTILETWTNLSLDPYSDNFVSKVIGDQTKNLVLDSFSGNYYVQVSGSFPNNSKYIRISNVSLLTPNYFDNNGNPKSQYTSSLPVTGSGSFSGATGTNIASSTMKFYNNIDGTSSQGLSSTDYTKALNTLANKDEYSFNLLVIPGVVAQGNFLSTVTSAISLVESRGDCLLIIDPAVYGSSLGQVTTNATALNSNYAAAYWPWLQTIDPNNGQFVWVPSSTLMLGVFAFNDRVSAPWFAPAGINRGALSGVIQTERKLSQSDRDTLYLNKVNPIATLIGQGVVAYGQKTLQTQATALDRINVRRLLIELKSYISQVSRTLVFEQNTTVTRNKFLSIVNPYLTSVQQRQGLYAFRVVMDDSNNTADVIDRNQLVGQIYIQPTKTVEFIRLDFNIQPTGATFE